MSSSATAPKVNDSSTGGPLLPSNAIDDGDQLTDLLQAFIVGVSGLPGPLVRPRWQPNEPEQPEATVDWAAVGITEQEPQDFPEVRHTGAANGKPGYSTLLQNETLTFTASFYGPNAKRIAEMAGRGAYIAQNRATLSARDVRLIDAGTIRQVPELINTVWVGRCDLTLRFRRQLRVVYPILDLIAASVETITDTGYQTTITTPAIEDD